MTAGRPAQMTSKVSYPASPGPTSYPKFHQQDNAEPSSGGRKPRTWGLLGVTRSMCIPLITTVILPTRTHLLKRAVCSILWANVGTMQASVRHVIDIVMHWLTILFSPDYDGCRVLQCIEPLSRHNLRPIIQYIYGQSFARTSRSRFRIVLKLSPLQVSCHFDTEVTRPFKQFSNVGLSSFRTHC